MRGTVIGGSIGSEVTSDTIAKSVVRRQNRIAMHQGQVTGKFQGG